jgi:hypothetical protein
MAVRKKFDKSVLGRGLDDIGSGRGLDALIDTSDVMTQGSSNLNEIPIDQIEPNPDQPRREFDEEALQELATSIQNMGIIAPITLRQVAPDHYQIIAGENADYEIEGRTWTISPKAITLTYGQKVPDNLKYNTTGLGTTFDDSGIKYIIKKNKLAGWMLHFRNKQK